MPSVGNQRREVSTERPLLGRQCSLPLTCHTSNPNLNLPWRESIIAGHVRENQGQKLNTELPYDPASALLCIFPRERKTSVHKKVIHEYLKQHDLQRPKCGNNPNVHQLMGKQNVAYPRNGALVSSVKE